MVLARQSLSALALVFAFALPAHATTFFASGFDSCATPDATDTNYWSVVNGTPSVTTDVEGVPGNLCALRFDPASGGTEYLSPIAWTGQSSLRAHFRITPRSNGGGSCTREALAFVGSGGDWSGKATILAVQATGNGVTLQAYYGSTTQKVCNGSLVDGKACTTAADCPAARPGAAQCGVAAFASSPLLNLNTTYEGTITQDNGTGSTVGMVTVGLYEGTGGIAPAAYERGTRTRNVGRCNGGGNDLAPCNVDSECPSGTCTTNVVAPTNIRLGTSDTTACAPIFDLDAVWVYDGDVRQNVSTQSLYPNAAPTMDTNWDAAGSDNGCASDADAWKCLTGSGEPNGDGSALANGNAAKPTVQLNLGPWATPTPQASPHLVAFEWMAQDRATGGTNATTARLEPKDDHGTYSGATAFFFDDFAGTGGANDPYYLAPPVYRETASDGSAWDFASLDALAIVFNKTAGSGNEGRITSSAATVFALAGNPPVPTVIVDQNADGEDTVCYFSDSTWNNDGFKNAIVAELVEADNVYFYTRDGSHLGDTAAEWALAVEGGAGTFLGLEVMRGLAGRRCDLIYVSGTVNWFFGMAMADPVWGASMKGVGQPGVCEDQGGPNQGANCWCPTRHPQTTNLAGTPAPNITPGLLRCINNGNFLGTPMPVLPGYCRCTTNADCTHGMATPGPTHSPAVCNTANPFVKYCQAITPTDIGVNAAPSHRVAWALPGCTDGVGCAGGLCRRRQYHSDLDALVADITAAANALTPNPPTIVWVVPPHLTYSGNAANMGDHTRVGLDYTRALFRRQPYFIDLAARFRQRFPEHGCASANNCTATEDLELCFRDGAHWTLGCELEAAATLNACATRGGSDGVCTAGACTAGLVGNPCASNAACDLRRCP